MNYSLKEAVVVDLDNSLVKTDVLFEQFLLLMKKKPWLIFHCLYLLIFKGMSHLKELITQKVELRPEILPYNQELLSEIKKIKFQGKSLHLVTGCSDHYAHQIAQHLRIFDSVYGSTKEVNLVGHNKLKLLKEKFGQSFSYIGDSKSDLVIWHFCQSGYFVKRGILNFFVQLNRDKSLPTFEGAAPQFKNLIKILRIPQWSKNLLIFIPIFLSSTPITLDLIRKGIYTFLSFSFCASGIYIMNDIADLWSDRAHFKKRKRPIASGDISLEIAFLMLIPIILFSYLFASAVSFEVVNILLIYFVLNNLYSLKLKRIIMLDAIVLSVLYLLRIYVGFATYKKPFSQNIFIFFTFFFLGLTFMKRFISLAQMRHRGNEIISKRGYASSDENIVLGLGLMFSMGACFTYLQYIFSNEAKIKFSNPMLLWISFFILIYSLGRMWLYSNRGKIDDDPFMYALKDRTSYLSVLLLIIFYYWAK